MENLTGKQLGAYRITEPLGEGGMATVYKAYQASMDRYVALKILPRHFAADPDFIHRFNREAKVIAHLEHPHILPVHDYGEAEGYTYMVMRFVKGGDLADCMAQKSLPLSEICRIITEVAAALDYAHGKGAVHRDIKPSNILMDDEGNCLLSDFGLAKMMIDSSQFTASGAFIGTPTYASPEQCMGKELDARSDIYSLGVVLYELITGRPPFRAETPMGVVLKHISDPLPLPHTIKPGISEAIEAVILKALAKNPVDRFQTAGELSAALRAAAQIRPGALEKPQPPAVLPGPVTRAAEQVGTVVLPQEMPVPQPRVVNPLPAKKRAPWVILVGCLVFLLAILGIAGLGSILIIPQMLKISRQPSQTTVVKNIPAATGANRIPTPEPTLTPVSFVEIVPPVIATLPVAPTYPSAPTPNSAAATPEPPTSGWQLLPGLPHSVHAVVVDPANPRVLYAGAGSNGSGSGVYKSQDGGQSWVNSSAGLPLEDVEYLEFSQNTLYAVVSYGLYASQDGALTWARVVERMGEGYSTNRFVISSDGHTFILLSNSAGVARSIDAGKTWVKSNQGLPQDSSGNSSVQSIAIAPGDAKIVYAGTGMYSSNGNGVYRSEDGGVSWQAANQGMIDVSITAIAVDPGEANTVYAGAYEGKLYGSKDGGASWQEIDLSNTNRRAIQSIYLNPSIPGELTVLMEDTGLLVGGAQLGWQNIALPQSNSYGQTSAFKIFFGQSPTYYLSIDNQGLWRLGSEPLALPTAVPVLSSLPTAEPLAAAGTWEQIQGLPRAINALAADPKDPAVIFAGTGQNGSGSGVYKSVDAGATWKKASAGLPNEDVLCMAFAGQNLYAIVGSRAAVYRSADSGGSWQVVSDSTNLYGPSPQLFISADGKDFYLIGLMNGVHHSTDGGKTWIENKQGLPLGNGNFVQASSFVIDPTNSKVLYLGTGYSSTGGNGVYKSTDGGANWKPANTGMLDYTITSLAVDPNQPALIYAGTYAGQVFVSLDGAQTWTKLPLQTGQSSDAVQALALDPGHSGRVLVYFRENGLQISSDGGRTWQQAGKPGAISYSDTQAALVLYNPQLAIFISFRDTGLYRYVFTP